MDSASIFVTAPNTLHPYDIDGMDNMARMEAEKAGKTLGRTFKGWYYLKSAHPEVTVGVDTSIAYLDSVLEKQGPFDGILGFSQGGSMAAVMCSVLEHRQLANNTGHPAFRFAIICSGYMLQDTKWQHLYEKPLSTPSLHMYGVLDPVIRFNRSIALQQAFANPEVLCSDGAHFIPRAQKSILTVAQFIDRYK
ncbi:Ovarian cancer-associated protein 2 [Coemansia sp. RSA 487]|nr:Ovarian cancer-associated protein 2 [Coemansia sp. RSA 1843]KAJ2210476.1 Ovarian cancer-associated protein 2 [Coemansia sp. RSA 487]